jgi:MFS family permease
MVGLLAFSAFSLLCGFSTSEEMLIAARALQGAAGAILAPSVFSITMVTFEEGAERNKALGILGTGCHRSCSRVLESARRRPIP